jgi:hypothetical protein
MVTVIFKEMGCKGLNWILLAQEGPVLGSSQHSNELLGFTAVGIFFNQLRNYHLTDSAPCSSQKRAIGQRTVDLILIWQY